MDEQESPAVRRAELKAARRQRRVRRDELRSSGKSVILLQQLIRDRAERALQRQNRARRTR